MKKNRWFWILATLALVTGILPGMVGISGISHAESSRPDTAIHSDTRAGASAGVYSHANAPMATPTLTPPYGGSGHIFMYNPNLGTARTGRMGAGGTFISLQAFSNFSRGWTSVIPIGNDTLLFYCDTNGSGATVRVNEDGSVMTLRNYYLHAFPYDSSNNIKVVSPGNGVVLFYQYGSGYGQIGHFDFYGNYTLLKSQFGYNPYWTQIAPTANGYLFFYQASNGASDVVRIDPNTGTLTNLHYYTLSTGWTNIVTSFAPESPQLNAAPMLFYSSGVGNGVTGGVSNDGSFRSVYGASLGTNWSVTALTNGNQFFYKTATGEAAVWQLNGDCSYTPINLSYGPGAFETGWDIVVGIL